MSRIDQLRKNYQRICGLPWDRNVAGPQKVWIAVYNKDDERKLRFRLGLFEEATKECGHEWQLLDLTEAFADWLCGPDNADFAESYFERPSRLGAAALKDFKEHVSKRLVDSLAESKNGDSSVLAVCGVGALFGFLRLSEILPSVETRIKGRLLLFFPGVYENDNYRLLDARDGWNYHAVPITDGEGEIRR